MFTCVQEQLLRTRWPRTILEHDNACRVTTGELLNRLAESPEYRHLHADIRDMLSDTSADWVRAHDVTPLQCTM